MVSCPTLALIFVISISADLRGQDTLPGSLDAAALSQQRDDVEFLSSEALRGRGVADETIVEAANYIAKRMDEIGLKTDLFDGSPMQSVEIPLDAQPGEVDRNQIRFKSSDQNEISGGLGSGMNPLAIGIEAGRFDGPLVFAGYGITAPKLEYDDYAGIDVNGAAVLMLRKEPSGEQADRVFNGKRNTRHAFFATKVSNAVAHGAGAVILVNDSASVEASIAQKQKRLEQEIERKRNLLAKIDQLPDTAANSRQSLTKQLASVESMIGAARNELKVAESGLIAISEAGGGTEKDKVIPVLSISRDLANRVLQRAADSSSSASFLDETEMRISRTLTPESRAIERWRVDLEVQLKPTTAKTANVIGVLPGKGRLANHSVVIGAHYDHVGMGGFGSLAPGTIAVHNGADDNASGTAVLLASAKQLRDRLARFTEHRRVIFIAFTGEERGLVGSKHYAKHPRFDLERTVAMINLDMVGRLRDNELTVYGTGSGVGMRELVDQINRRHRFDIYKVDSGYGPSDHQSFYEKGVPVLFFFTGLHNDYHRPTDDFDKIDFGGMARITDMVSDVASAFATRNSVPGYARTNDKIQIRRQLTAYLGVSLAMQANQIVLSAVTAGGPAERDGLQAGDTLEKIGKRSIRRIADVMEALRQYSPGDTVKIVVQRDNEKQTLTIKLATRPGIK